MHRYPEKTMNDLSEREVESWIRQVKYQIRVSVANHEFEYLAELKQDLEEMNKQLRNLKKEKGGVYENCIIAQ